MGKKKLIDNNFKGGWLSDEANIMCWALSCLNAKKIYGTIELYTDTKGKELLVDKLKLPYDKVHLVFDNNEFMDSIPAKLWALSKIYTYSLQTEPFIHIDGDFIFWKFINLNKDIICQNFELNKKTEDFLYSTSNMGIFGGCNISFIVQYANDVLEFIKTDLKNIDHIFLDSIDINCFFEQYYFFHYCQKYDVEINKIHPETLNVNLTKQVC